MPAMRPLARAPPVSHSHSQKITSMVTGHDIDRPRTACAADSQADASVGVAVGCSSLQYSGVHGGTDQTR
jgi:hypothetical protein